MVQYTKYSIIAFLGIFLTALSQNTQKAIIDNMVFWTLKKLQKLS